MHGRCALGANNTSPTPLIGGMASKVSQFVKEVVNFSSQYGTHGSRSYTAANLAGGFNIYDGYGDRTEAFVLRTYGHWWETCPSAPRIFRNSEQFRSQDFVEVRYEVPVVPVAIDIYETYHPGAVVRILACNTNLSVDKRKRHPGEVEWVTLFSGPTQCSNIARSRKFSPPIKTIDFPTNLLRLEFNSGDCGYYTELDGVELHGYIKEGMQEFRDRATDFKLSVTNQLLRMLSLSNRQISVGDDDDDDERLGYFSMLPDEIIQYIFKFLDLKSLCNASQVCSIFLKNAYDPMLYKELNLQPFWNTVDDIALAGLSARCGNMFSVNLSWTGGGGQVTEPSLCRQLYTYIHVNL
ncbi:F-box/LRR-repeat protein 4 [Geodia barretti]|uniref:F-box/LRR-repeat protein 4 n=1 Tax=Geodia barretti TaxID=519541 RepID=A0AA35RS51_GEOBA|nr:F-box/LRR-repeat protein 4 [Geodia barretti]